MTPQINPELFEASMALLSARTVQQFKVAHVLLAGGLYYDLDLGITAPDYESLEAAVVERVASLGPRDVMPAASRSLWLRFWNAPMDRCVPGVSAPQTRHCELAFVIRREVR